MGHLNRAQVQFAEGTSGSADIEKKCGVAANTDHYFRVMYHEFILSFLGAGKSSFKWLKFQPPVTSHSPTVVQLSNLRYLKIETQVVGDSILVFCANMTRLGN